MAAWRQEWTPFVALCGALLLPAAPAMAATNTFADLHIGQTGVLVGNSNDLFQVSGDFRNESTNRFGYDILDATFEFAGTNAHIVEQAGYAGGPCAGRLTNNFAFGVLRIAGGTVTVVDAYANLAGADAIYARELTGGGVLNVGPGMKFYFGSTNGWTGTVNRTGDGVFQQLLDPAGDPDGDGVPTWAECLAGTDPENSNSVFRIVAIATTNVHARVDWNTVGGHGYVLEATTNLVSGPFVGVSPVIAVGGVGEGTTNHVETGAATNRPPRFYRVRLEP